MLNENIKQSQHHEIDKLNIKSNLIYLVHSEIVANSGFYISFLYEKYTNSILDVKIKQMLLSKISSGIWNNMSIEAAKYFSKDLMKELVNYYLRLSNTEIYTSERVDDDYLTGTIKKQLSSSYTIFEFINKELGHKITIPEICRFGEDEVKVEPVTGDITIIKKVR